MTPRAESYLGADRNDPDQFFGAIQRETELVALLVNQDENVHMIDGVMAAHAQIDGLVYQAISGWINGQRVPRKISRDIRKNNKENEVALEDTIASNYELLRSTPYEENLVHFAHSSLKRETGVLQPEWRVSGLEFWSRMGMRNAFMPVVLEMIGQKGGRVVSPPDNSTLYTSLLHTAVAAESLNNMYAHLLGHEGEDKSFRAHIKSLQGLMLEYDAILNVYENLSPGEGHVIYNIPSSPSMDFGFGKHEKIDMVSIIFNKGVPHIMGIDVKKKHRDQQRANVGKMTLSALEIGCEVYVGGKPVCEFGKVCDEFIDGHLELNPSSPYRDPNYRLATALAVFGMNLEFLNKQAELQENSIS